MVKVVYPNNLRVNEQNMHPSISVPFSLLSGARFAKAWVTDIRQRFKREKNIFSQTELVLEPSLKDLKTDRSFS